ncbi:protein FAR1-RELATED SEQUENCE 6-like [Chenopodium quinoa]|uniref:protein FAR1-RELATED SEQUENCE 6-like n=1 Tax=Chenopodium quinoa TaxID=63459 RepID=UPI000B77F9BD|nr:protein FAR1-RELATED SEQUENCE 6-like [Chenopodium quinoa]
MMYCYGREERVIDEHNVHYYLEDRVWIVQEGRSEDVIMDKRRIYCVRFNREMNELSCDCCKFETFGIFCKHCIRVLVQNLVFKIPDKYILDRWRKDVVRKRTRVKVAYHDLSDTAEVKRFNKIMSEFEPICDEASAVDEDTVEMVIASLSKLRIEVKERRKKFIAKNGVQLLPSRKYPPSEKVSTNNVITPSSVTKPSAMYEGWVEGSIQEDVEWVDLEPEITESLVDPPPPVTQQVLDPKSRKHPRGRPKGSRNKTLAELGYKKKTKAILALVDENEPGADEVVAPTLADKPMNKRRK